MPDQTPGTVTTDPPDIPILPSSGSTNEVILVPVNQQDFDKYKRRQQRITSWTFGLITAAFLVCIIAVIGFLLDAWRFHSQTLDQYKQAIQQNSRERENRDSLNTMRNEIDALKNKLSSINPPVQTKSKTKKGMPINITNNIKIGMKDSINK